MPHAQIEIPSKLPLYSQKETVVFPYMLFPLYVPEKDAVIFREVDRYEKYVVLVFERPDDPTGELPAGRCDIGTLCKVTHIKKMEDGRLKVSLEGISRIRILDTEPVGTSTVAQCELVREFFEKNLVSEALVQSLNALLKIALSHGKPLPDDVMKMIDYIDNPARLSDLVALYVNLPPTELQELLETIDPLERLKKVYVHLTNEVQRMQIKSEVAGEVTKRVGKNQKEYILREQMKHIQEELGEEDPRSADINELRRKIEEAGLPEEIKKIADKELKRLERINQASPEYTVARTYLDYLAGMPWNVSSTDTLDMVRAEEILNEDHYNLKKVKERILEFLAVRSLKEDMKGPVLCFVGPPGVGKTSLGKSIARSMGRKFVRISLGGVRDEAEIRGHRRT